MTQLMEYPTSAGAWDLYRENCQLAESRASVENPNTPLSHPDVWLIDALGGGQSKTGVAVNRESAMTYAAVFNAVRLISTDVARVPLFVYQRSETGKERARSHPAYRILRRKANREITAFFFRQTMTGQALLLGNAYAFIERAGNGAPVGLNMLDPSKVTPVRANGILFYIYRRDGAVDLRLPASDVFHLRGLGFDGLQGYSVIAKARESLGMGLAARDFGARTYANNARPSVVLTFPGELKKEARDAITDSWNKQYQGLDNAGKTAILEHGFGMVPLSINMRDAQLIESRVFEIREVANWFSVPPHKLGDPTRSSFASLEQENQSYLDQSLDGWLVAWESEAWDKLLTERQKAADSHFVEFERRALVQSDLKTLGDFLRIATGGAAWMTPDEARDKINLNRKGGEADELHQPLNISPDDAEGAGASDGGGSGSDDGDGRGANSEGRPSPLASRSSAAEALRQVVSDTARRAVTKLTVQAKRAIKAGKLQHWIERGSDQNLEAIRAALTPVLVACRAEDRIDESVDLVVSGVRDAILDRGADSDGSGGGVETTIAELSTAIPRAVVDYVFENKGQDDED